MHSWFWLECQPNLLFLRITAKVQTRPDQADVQFVWWRRFVRRSRPEAHHIPAERGSDIDCTAEEVESAAAILIAPAQKCRLMLPPWVEQESRSRFKHAAPAEPVE